MERVQKMCNRPCQLVMLLLLLLALALVQLRCRAQASVHKHPAASSRAVLVRNEQVDRLTQQVEKLSQSVITLSRQVEKLNRQSKSAEQTTKPAEQTTGLKEIGWNIDVWKNLAASAEFTILLTLFGLLAGWYSNNRLFLRIYRNTLSETFPEVENISTLSPDLRSQLRLPGFDLAKEQELLTQHLTHNKWKLGLNSKDPDVYTFYNNLTKILLRKWYTRNFYTIYVPQLSVWHKNNSKKQDNPPRTPGKMSE